MPCAASNGTRHCYKGFSYPPKLLMYTKLPGAIYFFSHLQASMRSGTNETAAGRILFVVSTFDRGESTRAFKGRDKFDFILMMMDEMREACEVRWLKHMPRWNEVRYAQGPPAVSVLLMMNVGMTGESMAGTAWTMVSLGGRRTTTVFIFS